MPYFRLLLVCFLFGCSCFNNYDNLKTKYPVEAKYKKAYLSSVYIMVLNHDLKVGKGSGTIIENSANKYLKVITAAHVIGDNYKGKLISVSLTYNNERRIMKVLKIDYELDLAILISYTKEKEDGPFIKIAEKYSPKLGSGLYAIGSPFGDKYTITKGILSYYREVPPKILYKITAHISFGSSGGGVFNENDELIGVVHAIEVIRGLGIIPGQNFAISLESIYLFNSAKK